MPTNQDKILLGDIMEDKELLIDNEVVEDNEPLLGQITFDELIAELRLS